MSNIQIFMTFHTWESIKPFRDIENLVFIDLNVLRHNGGLASPELAENRFFLDPPDLEKDKTWVGLCSPRWDQKWPMAPKVRSLASLSGLDMPDRAYAPGLAQLSKSSSETVYPDLVMGHPGMEKPLEALVREFNLNLPSTGNAPWANSFIVHRDVYLRLLEFWREAFSWANNVYGLNFPFGFRCLECGHEDQSRIGRYGRERLAAFFYERVTMLFFLTVPLDWLKPDQEGIELGRLRKLRSGVQAKMSGKLSFKRRCTLCGNPLEISAKQH